MKLPFEYFYAANHLSLQKKSLLLTVVAIAKINGSITGKFPSATEAIFIS